MKENKLNTFFSWFLVTMVFLLPIFFIPYTINPLINSKMLLLLITAFVAAFVFIAKSLQTKGWELIKTPFTLSLAGFAILVAVSSLVSHQYPSQQFLGMGGAYLAFTFIILLAPSLLKKGFSKWFSLAINVSAIILSILSISQLFGGGLALIINRISVLDMPNSLAFSLTGATFTVIQFLSVVLIANVFDQRSWKNSIFNKVTTILIAIALGINIWSVLPGGEAKFQSLPLVDSADIAKGSLTLTKNALFGYGPDSYGNAYNILKPIWINGSSYWKFTFDSAFNLPLTLLVSVGSIALLVYLLFFWQCFTTVKKSGDQELFLKAFIFAAFIWQFFAPVNLLMLALLAIALGFFVSAHQDQYAKIDFKVKHFSDLLNLGKLVKTRNLFFIGTNLVLVLVLASALYISTKTFVAYHLFYRSNAAISKNEIAKAYDYQKKGSSFAPQIDFVRRSYSLINLQIAIALSNKADISPAEQEQVLQLVNQAIREARAATVLDPANYQNWSVLAQIYMQLLGTTDQAKQEAFNALAKEATYNPNNPEIRIFLGQLFLNTERYPEAVTFFNQAIEKKPDLFVAHYYLAKALIANNQLEEAKKSFLNSLSLLSKDSAEYAAIEKELNALNIKSDETVKKDQDLSKTPTASGSSSLSSFLDKKDTESVIQDGALTSDQALVEN